MNEITLLFKTPANHDITSGPIARKEAGAVYIQAKVTSEDEIIGELYLEVSSDNVDYIQLEETVKEVAAPGNFNWDGVATNAKYVRLVWKYEGGEGEISANANI